MGRRKDHTRDELKELILTAGQGILMSEGASALTVRNIAQKIGYAAGTIYNVFPSMEELNLHLNGRTLDKLYEVLSSPSCRNPQRTLVQNMKQMAGLYISYSEDWRPIWMFLFTVPLDGQHKGDWYSEKVARLFEPLQMLLKENLNHLDDAAIKEHARILWASVHGLVYLRATEKAEQEDKKFTKKLVNRLIETYAAGLKQPSVSL